MSTLKACYKKAETMLEENEGLEEICRQVWTEIITLNESKQTSDITLSSKEKEFKNIITENTN